MGRKIIIKSSQQIENIKDSGKYLNELLQKLKDKANPDVSLYDLEQTAKTYIQKNNLKGAFKGFMGYPANLCLSLNDCVVHGIPDKTLLKPGDVLKIDLGINYKGGITDSAVTKVIGKDGGKAQELVDVTKQGLDNAMEKIGHGAKMIDFSKTVYDYVVGKGFNVLKNLVGHGVGVEVHEPPYIYNRPHPEANTITFKENMVVALEPICALYSNEAINKPHNKRPLYTAGGDVGAQREYTILVTQNGYEIISGLK